MAEERDRPGAGRDQRPQSDRHQEGPEDDDKSEPGDEDYEAGPAWLHSGWFKIAVGVGIVVVAMAALIWWLVARRYEETDDAFIDTHIVHVSPQIAGQIIRVAVDDNELVHKGQLLALIDPRDETTRLNQATAQLAAAEAQVAQAKASALGAEAQAQSAREDLARYNLLKRTAPTAVAQQQIDQATATERNTIAQENAALAQVKGAMAQIKVYRAEIATAQLNLGYTRILASIDGHVAQRTVAVGNYVTPGQELMAIVPLHLWVTANFKETQLALMHVGQPVTVSVDACSGREIRGHVDSIQHGAGQAFDILPPENAAGNFVKVVQRVPVKIVLDRVPKSCVLGPGMSVEPSVKVR